MLMPTSLQDYPTHVIENDTIEELCRKTGTQSRQVSRGFPVTARLSCYSVKVVQGENSDTFLSLMINVVNLSKVYHYGVITLHLR